jgi:aminoglycoside/choline kinase family phosphotransferase
MTATAAAGRHKERRLFLDGIGWQAAQVAPLQPDASFRSYARVRLDDTRRMLMDAPPGREDLRAYLDITAHLRGLGLRVAHTYEVDEGAGFALIEDMGDDTFTRLLDAGHDEMALYLLATDVLRALHDHTDATAIPLPPYDMQALLTEAELFVDWFVPALRGGNARPAEKQAYMNAWQAALAGVADAREALVLRDYHVDNLMILGAGETIAHCGLLDYQDALIGSRAYDLISLVEDARRDVSPHVQAAVLDRYCADMDDAARTALITDMTILGAQRHAKVAGIFIRLSKRDSKPIYLRHIPRVLRLMAASLEHETLAGVKQAVEAMVPGYTRASF